MHVITDLEVGGAETMLKRLIEAQRENPEFRHTVVSLKGMGEVGRQLESLGVEVRALEMRSALNLPGGIWRLARQISSAQPDIVQTWMYHADLVAGWAAWLAGMQRVIWCVHSTTIPQQGLSATGIVVWLCTRWSRILPAVIVCCAESARKVHERKGYAAAKMVVVPNGFDLRAFYPTAELRREARRNIGFGEGDLVVGTVGRFDRLKNYRDFVKAAAALAAEDARAKFLMVGRGLEMGNEELRGWLEHSGAADRFVLTGERRDVAACLAAMDVFCLSSLAEAFPNVVCEAMAMKVPCVVTDVGDAATIVGETGIVVEPENPEKMAAGLHEMLSKNTEERAKIGELARVRIQTDYSIENVTLQFDAIYARLLGDSPGARESFEATQTQ